MPQILNHRTESESESKESLLDMLPIAQRPDAYQPQIYILAKNSKKNPYDIKPRSVIKAIDNNGKVSLELELQNLADKRKYLIGACAKVKEGYEPGTNTPNMAVKIFTNAQGKSFQAQLIDALKYDYCLSLLGQSGYICERSGQVYIISDWIAGSDLFDIYNQKKISDTTYKNRLLMLLELTKDLHILHSHGILLGDLKPENIMFDGTRLRLIDLDSVSFEGKCWSGIYTPDYLDPVSFEYHTSMFRDENKSYPIDYSRLVSRENDIYAFKFIICCLFHEFFSLADHGRELEVLAIDLKNIPIEQHEIYDLLLELVSSLNKQATEPRINSAQDLFNSLQDILCVYYGDEYEHQHDLHDSTHQQLEDARNAYDAIKQSVNDHAEYYILGEKLLNVAETGDIQAFNNLIKQGVDINYKNKYDVTAIDVASGAGQFNIVSLLICNNVTITSSRAIRRAAQYKHNYILQLLLGPNFALDTNEPGNDSFTALDHAVLSDNEEGIKLLFRAEVKPTIDCTTKALHLALELHDLRLATLLIESEPNINFNYSSEPELTLLDYAIELEFYEAVGLLCTKSNQITLMHALCRATQKEDFKSIATLINHGANPWLKDKDRCCADYCASFSRRSVEIKALLNQTKHQNHESPVGISGHKPHLNLFSTSSAQPVGSALQVARQRQMIK